MTDVDIFIDLDTWSGYQARHKDEIAGARVVELAHVRDPHAAVGHWHMARMVCLHLVCALDLGRGG